MSGQPTLPGWIFGVLGSEQLGRIFSIVARGLAGAWRHRGVAGVLRVELIVTPTDEFQVKQLASFSQNTRPGSIAGAVTSQFAQQRRAAYGLRLGETKLRQPRAKTNWLGEIWQTDDPDWLAALASPGIFWHQYGKHKPRPGRKLRRLTAFAKTPGVTIGRVLEARRRLGPFPDFQARG